MKPKKLCERDPICVLKKTYSARCGFLCGTLMMCAALAVLNGSSLVNFFVDSKCGYVIYLLVLLNLVRSWYEVGTLLKKMPTKHKLTEGEICSLTRKFHFIRREALSVVLAEHTCRKCSFEDSFLSQSDAAAADRRGISIHGKIGPFEDAFWCNRTDINTDVCLLRGNVHVVTGNSSSVVLHSRICEHVNMSGRIETIKPYPRKLEANSTMTKIQSIPLHCVDDSKEKSLSPKDGNRDKENVCDETHTIPAILFSSGGFSLNFYHAFQDILIPLFILSQHLKGDVVLVTSDIRPDWIERWSKVLHQLSRYPIIDLNEESGQQCFPEVVAGTYLHGQLGLDPSLMPNNETMDDFQRFLYEALASTELKQSKIPGGFSAPLQTDRKLSAPMKLQTRLPKLLIIERTHTRVLLNQEEVVELARELKFDVKVGSLSNDMDLETIYGLVHTSDVMMGVHGAGMANMLFMRRNAVLVQIVPLGTDWPSSHFYAMPASSDLGLNYMEYKITPEESSLSEKYGLEHPIVQDPQSYLDKGWEFQQTLYLFEQSVRPSLSGLRETLMAARSAALLAFS